MNTKAMYAVREHIYDAIKKNEMNGDSFIPVQDLISKCCSMEKSITWETFALGIEKMVEEKEICIENSNIYSAKTYQYEIAAALSLRDILERNVNTGKWAFPFPDYYLSALCEEQTDAVRTALSHKLSLITGGAGTGKTTLIKAIIGCWGRESSTVLCAPTGKAARNLTEKTGFRARTVHSALGLRPDEDFLTPVKWSDVSLIVVDEASMLTLEMMAGILQRARKNCCIVLIGDPNQLQSVGCGNVMNDLLLLGIPHVHLELNHRQDEGAAALLENITNFSKLSKLRNMNSDESLQINLLEKEDAYDSLVQEASRAYYNGENIQVITPFKEKTKFSAKSLNAGIKAMVNPYRVGERVLRICGMDFHDGDRVMITQNSAEHDCTNGDIGTLRLPDKSSEVEFYIELADGRRPQGGRNETPIELIHAYALTVHKSQGSEYDRVLMPVTEEFACMMNRNLVYTAISRARKQVVFYGSDAPLGEAMGKPMRRRLSNLPQRVKAYAEAAEPEVV